MILHSKCVCVRQLPRRLVYDLHKLLQYEKVLYFFQFSLLRFMIKSRFLLNILGTYKYFTFYLITLKE